MPWDRAQPAPLAVWNLIHPRFPNLRFEGFGIYNPGHGDHGEGRALDLGRLLVSEPEEHVLALGLIRVFQTVKTEMSWSYLIYDQDIYYSDIRGQQRGGFVGDHTNHIHVSWSRANSQTVLFPQLIRELDFLATGGGVEDEGSQSSVYRPYSS
jgi:hypothetical protein